MLLNLQKPLARLSRVRGRWLIARSRISDRKWYQAEYTESGGAGSDPIMHYLLSGADRGYRPHLLFDPAWYTDCVEELRSFLAWRGHQFPEDISEIAAYLRGVAAQSASLRATDHPGFVDRVLRELKTLAVRG